MRLSNGGYNRAYLKETEQAKSAAESNLKSATLQVDREVYTDYANTTVAEQQIDLATKADQEAKQNLAFAEGRYSAGVGNIIELTDSELLAATAGRRSSPPVTAINSRMAGWKLPRQRSSD